MWLKVKTILIAAVSDNGVIGINGGIPWRMSGDMKRFRLLTTGDNENVKNVVVMGRKTYESIGKPLPNRRNIVVSRSAENIDGCEVVRSLDELQDIEIDSRSKVFVIGGGEIYRQSIDKADELYITHIHTTIDCNNVALFPEIDNNIWKGEVKEETESDEKNEYKSTFVIYSKLSK